MDCEGLSLRPASLPATYTHWWLFFLDYLHIPCARHCLLCLFLEKLPCGGSSVLGEDFGREGRKGITGAVMPGSSDRQPSFLQGGLGVFVQLMPILILILVSALSQLMVSSPPYSLSPRP